jgi:uncharacterized membrane protein
MSATVQKILESMERLSDGEKRELVSEIIRGTVDLDFPPSTDEELVLLAEEIFLELDKRESADE